MRTPKLSTLLVAAALGVAPSATALAEPSPVADTATHDSPSTQDTTAPAAADPASSDAERYAAREAKDKPTADFEGGGRGYLYIGGGTVTLVLLVVLLVILL